MFSVLLALAFSAYAVRRALFLLGQGHGAKALVRNGDKYIFLSLALVAVAANRFPAASWLAPAILVIGAVVQKEEKFVFDKRENRILSVAIAFSMLLALNIDVLLAPLFVLLLPLPLILIRKK